MSANNGFLDGNKIEVFIPANTNLNELDTNEAESDKDIKGTILQLLLSEQTKLKKYAAADIVFSPPIINLNGDIPVFRRGTINIVQGKFGSHKSRLAELFCSLLLKNVDCNTDFAGFKRQQLERFAVLYIDTERNLKEEFPYAIQTIRRRAGFDAKQEIPEFHFFSIKKIDRKERLDAVKQIIEYVRRKEKLYLFVVLDVVTDCVASFNNDVESMSLFDYLGNLCDDFEVTFLLIIHENYGTEKARGHTGSEGANKSSTMMQIGFEKGNNNEETDLIKLKFIKLRTAKKPSPIYLEFDPESKGLVCADPDLISDILKPKVQKADVDFVIDRLGDLLKKPMKQRELVEQLCKDFDCSANTIKDRLKTIVEEQHVIFNLKGEECLLEMDQVNGKATIYGLVPIDNVEKTNSVDQDSDR